MTALLLPVMLEYSAPAACPGLAQFWQQAQRAEPSLALAEAPEEGPRAPRERRSYRVEILESEGGFVGELREASGPLARRVEARDCAEVAEVLSLALALSAKVSPRDVAPPERSEPAAGTALQELSPPQSSVAASTAPHRDRAASPHPAAAPRWAVSLGAFGLFGATPGPLVGAGLSLSHRVTEELEPRFELRAAGASGDARATFVGVAPALCVTAFEQPLDLAACGGLAAGYLDVRGVEYSASPDGPQSSWWVAPMLRLRAGVDLGGGWFFQAFAEVEHGVITRAYLVKSAGVQFRTASLSPLFGAGFEARFE